jgi:CRP-like cAMP-binding protein
MLVKKIAFFMDKNINFVQKVIQRLRPRSVFQGEMLFSQGDVADEVYFVIQGGFTKYVDLSDVLDLPPNLIDPSEEAFNVPYVTYVSGSYFGDSDCWPSV